MSIYDLAYTLRMPVYVLLEKMPYEEMINWGLYFNARPVGWREDQRTAMMLNAAGVKEKPHNLFSSLAILKKLADTEPEEVRLGKSLVNSGLLARLQAAAAHNKIDWKVSHE